MNQLSGYIHPLAPSPPNPPLSVITELPPLNISFPWLSASSMVVYICQCFPLNSSHLLTHCVHKSALYVRVSIPALIIGPSVHFPRFHKYALIYNICVSFSDLLHFMEKAVAPHSSTLAWKLPWMKEPGRLQSMGLRRVGHDWPTALSLLTFMYWRKKWQPTPVFLPGESQGRWSLVGCHIWDHTESDITEVT